VSTVFSGLFRAIVIDNRDPSGLMRVKVVIPEIFSEGTASWAAACLVSDHPIIPEEGDEVWIAFERGDPDYPVWLGKAVSQPLEIRKRR